MPQETPSLVADSKAADLRKRLVQIALEWESYFGVAPSITSSLSELDAALLVGMKEDTYCADGKLRTAVSKDTDFICNGIRYQVTATRPSGKRGSPVTLVGRKTEEKRPFGWDRIIWILYDRFYVLQEAWEFTAAEYRTRFSGLTRLSPNHMRQGRCLFMGTPSAEAAAFSKEKRNHSLKEKGWNGKKGRREMMTQRDMMLSLVAKFGLHEGIVCTQYAAAENRGEVARKRNKFGLTPEEYARALWRDGVRK